MELVSRWFKVSEDLPPAEYPTPYPFVEKDFVDDPHSGWYMGDSDGNWWCDICQDYIEPSKVVAWFALPLYKE